LNLFWLITEDAILLVKN